MSYEKPKITRKKSKSYAFGWQKHNF